MAQLRLGAVKVVSFLELLFEVSPGWASAAQALRRAARVLGEWCNGDFAPPVICSCSLHLTLLESLSKKFFQNVMTART